MNKTVDLRVHEGVAEIVLNRPHRLNAINGDLLSDFATALRAASVDATAGVILLRGEGLAFCAGDDLKDFDAQSGKDAADTQRFIENIQEITRLLMGSELIVVGAIHGWAVGGGLEWVLNCDIAVMAEGCRCFFPETSLGVFVTGGITSILPNVVGLQKAKELILLGDRFTAQEAADWGLVARTADDDDYLEVAQSLAKRIRDLPRIARQNVKKVLNRSFQLPLRDAMELETQATVEGFRDPATAARIAGAITP